MAAVRNGIVKEADGQVDMQACAITCLTIGIDRAAMPDGLQRLNPRRHNPP